MKDRARAEQLSKAVIVNRQIGFMVYVLILLSDHTNTFLNT